MIASLADQLPRLLDDPVFRSRFVEFFQATGMEPLHAALMHTVQPEISALFARENAKAGAR